MAQTYQQLLDAIGLREPGGRYNIKKSTGYSKNSIPAKDDWAGTSTGKDGITLFHTDNVHCVSIHQHKASGFGPVKTNRRMELANTNNWNGIA